MAYETSYGCTKVHSWSILVHGKDYYSVSSVRNDIWSKRIYAHTVLHGCQILSWTHDPYFLGARGFGMPYLSLSVQVYDMLRTNIRRWNRKGNLLVWVLTALALEIPISDKKVIKVIDFILLSNFVDWGCDWSWCCCRKDVWGLLFLCSWAIPRLRVTA